MHFILVCIHLLCVVLFVGYVFFDACIYPLASKVDQESCSKVKKAYAKGSSYILGGIFLGLIISGGILLSYYEFDPKSFFWIFFGIKLILFAGMLIVTFYSLFCVIVLKKNDPFKNKSHLIALIFCLGIVIAGKAMQYF